MKILHAPSKDLEQVPDQCVKAAHTDTYLETLQISSQFGKQETENPFENKDLENSQYREPKEYKLTQADRKGLHQAFHDLVLSDPSLSHEERERFLNNSDRTLGCRNKVMKMDCCNCGGAKAALYYCNTRICPECGKKNADNLFHQYKQLISGVMAEAPVAAVRAMGRSYKMVTFTARKTDDVKVDVDNICRWVRVWENLWFRRRGIRKIGTVIRQQLQEIDGMTPEESQSTVTEIWDYIKNKFGSWHRCNGAVFCLEAAGDQLDHIHVHSLILSKYIPNTKEKPWLMWTWRAITGGSMVVDIHEVKAKSTDPSGVLDALREVLKYLYKPMSIKKNFNQLTLTKETSPYLPLARLWLALFDVRRVWSTGLFYNPGLPDKEPCKCPVCRESHFKVSRIYSIEQWFSDGMRETLDQATDAKRRRCGPEQMVLIDEIIGRELADLFYEFFGPGKN